MRGKADRDRALQHLQRAAAADGFDLHPTQLAAARRLSGLSAEIGRHGPRFGRPPRGVYLWGPVGRGKSWLLDQFFAAAPVKAKRRTHFHDFFHRLHTAAGAHRGEPRAIDRAVADLLDGCRLLCFDEFHVPDVGDAMLVTHLLRALFERRITLVATSNYAPAGLLPNPLYHDSFLPGIALLTERVDVIKVAGPTDYRARADAAGTRAGFGRGALVGDQRHLVALGLPTPQAHERAQVAAGPVTLTALAARDGLVWFDFAELCDRPVSAHDILALAARFDTWVVTGLPSISRCGPDPRQRFVNLVDVLCDREAELFLAAGPPVADIAALGWLTATAGADLPPDIGRTASRLTLLRRPRLPNPTDSVTPQRTW